MKENLSFNVLKALKVNYLVTTITFCNCWGWNPKVYWLFVFKRMKIPPFNVPKIEKRQLGKREMREKMTNLYSLLYKSRMVTGRKEGRKEEDRMDGSETLSGPKWLCCQTVCGWIYGPVSHWEMSQLIDVKQISQIFRFDAFSLLIFGALRFKLSAMQSAKIN